MQYKQEKKKRIDKKTLLTRIFVIFLAVLMLGGTVAMAIVYVTNSQADLPAVEQTAAAPLYEKNQKMRVGLAFGSSSVKCVLSSSSCGFSLGIISNGYDYSEIIKYSDTISTSQTAIAVSCDTNLNVNYQPSDCEDSTAFGAYHIMV